jgi:hypothetical protein
MRHFCLIMCYNAFVLRVLNHAVVEGNSWEILQVLRFQSLLASTSLIEIFRKKQNGMFTKLMKTNTCTEPAIITNLLENY